MNIFNIDKALQNAQIFNVMHDALDELYSKRQEEFEKNNPLTKIYTTVKLNKFQKSFGSSTGFKQAFEQTVDYSSYPGFTSADGFKTTISYKPFNGKLVFTWQTLLEADYEGIKDELVDYQVAWQRQIVEYGMFALTAFFGQNVYDKVAKSFISIKSADTVSGLPMDEVHNPVFTNAHTIVKTDEMSATEFNSFKQSNKFYVDIKLDGSDPLAYSKLANALYQIKVGMNKYFDDNGKRAGVSGKKTIVSTECAHLNMAINSILAADNFSTTTGTPSLNPAKGMFETIYTPYLNATID